MSRRLVWFSCGAPSAVAAKLTVQDHPEALVVYCDTMANEHPDNPRFFRDVQEWIGKPITVIRSEKYPSVDAVIQKERYMAGPNGARCTVELKKIPRFAFQQPDDIHIFGYTIEPREVKRALAFKKNNPELLTEWVLISRLLSKADCKSMVLDAGIALPKMYEEGFSCNNCIGCVKVTAPAYWNRVRRLYPAVFETRRLQSRELGVRLVQLHKKRISLDDLPAEATGGDESVECGPHCIATPAAPRNDRPEGLR